MYNGVYSGLTGLIMCNLKLLYIYRFPLINTPLETAVPRDPSTLMWNTNCTLLMLIKVIPTKGYNTTEEA